MFFHDLAKDIASKHPVIIGMCHCCAYLQWQTKCLAILLVLLMQPDTIKSVCECMHVPCCSEARYIAVCYPMPKPQI